LLFSLPPARGARGRTWLPGSAGKHRRKPGQFRTFVRGLITPAFKLTPTIYRGMIPPALHVGKAKVRTFKQHLPCTLWLTVVCADLKRER
jgi:hypothetical protein